MMTFCIEQNYLYE